MVRWHATYSEGKCSEVQRNELGESNRAVRIESNKVRHEKQRQLGIERVVMASS